MDRIYLSIYTLNFITSIFTCQYYTFQDFISFLCFRNSIPSGKVDIFAAEHHFLDKGNSPRKVIFKM